MLLLKFPLGKVRFRMNLVHTDRQLAQLAEKRRLYYIFCHICNIPNWTPEGTYKTGPRRQDKRTFENIAILLRIASISDQCINTQGQLPEKANPVLRTLGVQTGPSYGMAHCLSGLSGNTWCGIEAPRCRLHL